MSLLVFAIILLAAVLFIRALIPLGILLFVPSNILAVKRMVALAKIRPGMKTIDLGSGDGRVVMAFAKAGAKAYGYEINPFLVMKSRQAIKKAGLADKAHIYLGNFYFHNLSSYDIITLFQSPLNMKLLEKKIQRELKPGAKVISSKFTFPNWPCEYQVGNIYIYKN